MPWTWPLAVLGLLIAVAMIILLPRKLASSRIVPDPAKRLELENEIRKTIVQVVGGAFLLLGVFFTSAPCRSVKTHSRLLEKNK
jgi:hypothetical protein